MRYVRLLMLVCAALAFACGPQRAAVPGSGPDLIVLLPDSVGAVGRATVANQSGTTTLDSARQATRVVPGRAPAPAGALDDATIKTIFGDALASLPRSPLSLLLFFRLESDDLTEESRARVPEVLKALASYTVPEVVAIGHTDTSGDRKANVALGLSRANAVRDILVKSGVERSLIEVVSHGETDLLIPTADDMSESRNRRVEITVR